MYDALAADIECPKTESTVQQRTRRALIGQAQHEP